MYKLAVLSIVLIALARFFYAQDIRIEEAWNDTDNLLVCGKIESGQLTIPSYKFRVTNKNGAILKTLRTKGELVIEEYVWVKNGFFDMDPYWKPIRHYIDIPVTYDPKTEVYSTEEVSKVVIPRGKKDRKCLHKVSKLIFSFYLNDCDSTGFIFFFPNRTVDKINLPNSEKVFNLGIIDGYSCVRKD